MLFLFSLDRRGGREWSGRRKSWLLTPSVRLRPLSEPFALATHVEPEGASRAREARERRVGVRDAGVWCGLSDSLSRRTSTGVRA